MKWNLKPDSSADHSAYTWATGPSAADLAFRPDVSVWTADSHATTAAVTIVVGVERTREAGGGGARVRVGELEGLHRSRERKGVQIAFMILKKKIVLCYFREVRRRWRRRLVADLRLADLVRFLEERRFLPPVVQGLSRL